MSSYEVGATAPSRYPGPISMLAYGVPEAVFQGQYLPGDPG